MQLLNENARALHKAASALGVELTSGYFGQTECCVAIHVASYNEAFSLGGKLGDQYGTVTTDRWPGEAGAWLVFADARASA